MAERQTNYTISGGYELPSKGLVYDQQINTHVELRSMTARDEMKRLSPSVTPLKTLADIIEGCMIEKPAIHVYDMCLGDYEYLLHKLRIVTYGDQYAISTRCPYCGEEISTEVSLDSLRVKEFTPEEYEALKSFTLPVSGKLVSLKLQTPRMLDNMDITVKDLKRKRKNAEIDFETLVKLTTSIESVDGRQLADYEIEAWLLNLPAKDMQKILTSIDKLNSLIGIDATFTVDCQNCNSEVRSFFRFGTEFFRPSNI